MTGHLLVLSTVAQAEDAERIARTLVERRLAACVNVVPGLVSFYRWKGDVQRDDERLLLIKARRDFQTVEHALQQSRLHNAELREQARRLRDDAKAVEEVARRELGLIKPGEKLFIIKEAGKK